MNDFERILDLICNTEDIRYSSPYKKKKKIKKRKKLMKRRKNGK